MPPTPIHFPNSLGLRRHTVLLSDFNSEWAVIYLAERARLAAALGPEVAFEHTGSTSIPGIRAKPILDINAGFPVFPPIEVYRPILEGLSYEFMGDMGIPERHFFVLTDPTKPPDTIVIHLNLVARGSKFWNDHLLFRDFLRAHGSTRQAYEDLKRELSLRFPNEREAYTSGKASFIESVLAQARKEKGMV